MVILTDDVKNKVLSILNTIKECEINNNNEAMISELQTVIYENNLTSVLSDNHNLNVNIEILKKDIENVIQIHSMEVDIHNEDVIEAIDNTVDVILNEYDYSDYNNFIFEVLKEELN